MNHLKITAIGLLTLSLIVCGILLIIWFMCQYPITSVIIGASFIILVFSYIAGLMVLGNNWMR
jgi:hypothetical protein